MWLDWVKDVDCDLWVGLNIKSFLILFPTRYLYDDIPSSAARFLMLMIVLDALNGDRMSLICGIYVV